MQFFITADMMSIQFCCMTTVVEQMFQNLYLSFTKKMTQTIHRSPHLFCNLASV